MGRTADLKALLRGVRGADTIHIKYIGGLQFVSWRGDVIKLDAMASNDEIIAALAKIDSAILGKSMSITGANRLSANIKDKIAAAKARMSQVSDGTDAALAKFNEAADSAEAVSKKIETEAAELLAEIGQFDNGGPA